MTAVEFTNESVHTHAVAQSVCDSERVVSYTHVVTAQNGKKT